MVPVYPFTTLIIELGASKRASKINAVNGFFTCLGIGCELLEKKGLKKRNPVAWSTEATGNFL